MCRFHFAILIGLLVLDAVAQPARGDLLVNYGGSGTVLSSLSNADDAVVHRSLPFPLRLYDRTYTGVDVSTNGNVNFSNNVSYSNVALPNPAMTAIMPLWDDLKVDTSTPGVSPLPNVIEFSGDAYYSVTWQNVAVLGSGTPPQRHTFQAAWFGNYSFLNGFDFQPDDIAFSYANLGAAYSGGKATVGLQGESFEKFSTLPGTVGNDGLVTDTSLLPAGTNQFLLFRPVDTAALGSGYMSAALQVTPAIGAINVLEGLLPFNGSQAVSRDITGNGFVVKAGPGTLTLSGNNTHAGTLVLDGTLRTSASSAIPAASDLGLFDGVTFDPYSNAVTVSSIYLYGGQVSLGAGSLTATASTQVLAPTTIDLKGGTLSTATLSGAGKLQFANGTLQISGASGLTIGTGPLGATVTLGAGQRLRVDMVANILSGSVLEVGSGGAFGASTIDNSGEIVLEGETATLGIGGGQLENFGLVRGEGEIATYGVHNFTGGEIRAEAGKRLRFDTSGGASYTNAGKINLQDGTAEFTQPFTNSASGQILGRGTLIVGGAGLTNNGNIALSSGITDVFGKITNNTGNALKGITVSGNADVTFWDDVTNTAPSLFKVAAGSSATFFGTFSGAGVSGTGSKYFEADVSPGASPASVDFGGDVYLDSTARLIMELGGNSPGNYDQVRVAGQLTLDGALTVSLLPGFTPVASQSFDLLDWNSLSGTFSSLVLPALTPGLMWNASQLYTTGMLGVFLAGDYNGNGIVDAADYVVWRKTLGQTGVGLAADGNGNGTIDSGDFNVWRANLGQSAGSGSGAIANAAVPEPATLVLLMLAAAAGECSRRRPSA